MAVSEVVWAVHAENKARHIHFIVNAVSFDDGRKLHVTQRDWQRMKDDCRSQCNRYGLYELDWRAADAVERQSETPVEETFAEHHREIKGKYKKLKRLRRAEWAIDPRNRRKCLGMVLWALIVLSTNELDITVKQRIEDLKRKQDQLRRDVQNFKKYQKDASDTLRDKELSVDAYMAAVAELQISAECLVTKSARLVNEKERVQLQRAIDRRNKT